MKTPDDTTIQQYLKAVERETSGLPPVRRQELLADLAEHIDVALAERPRNLDTILCELGDPRTIAATALNETGTAPHRTRPGPATVVLLQVAFILALVLPSPAHELVGAALRITGLVLLWRSWWWTTRHKAVGTLAVHLVPYGLIKLIQATLPWTSTAMLVTNTVIALLYLGGCTWLWHTRHRTDLVMR
ncbi:HAAS signaling domain-containing protein [Streptomyces mirabilis]|uniref:HAAS signaling domain-containing protein n=1 Tax=Streptomyces mirabilis TaxID=68239 RepID=UPI00332CABC1